MIELTITVLRHADPAASHLKVPEAILQTIDSNFSSKFVGRDDIYLGIIVGAVGDDGEGEDNDGKCGGEPCHATEAGVSRH